jgi:Na+-transporting NADH:ubiquinone oxidoreductase subunit C
VKDNFRTILFAIVLGVVCSATLAVASTYLSPYRKANEEAEKVRNYLAVLDIQIDKDWDSKTLLAVYKKKVRTKKLGDLTLYENISASSPIVAVPFSGPGLWAPVEGVVSFESDLTTIHSIRFYKQEETPGLGGEIGSAWFQEQFKGKKIVSNDGKPGFTIVKAGKPTDSNSVDGITGATMTSERVQAMLDSLAKKLWKERDNYVQ